MGKYSDMERMPRDWYPTPEKATRPIYPLLSFYGKPLRFIEPCWGNGVLQRNIEANTSASCVYASDIAPIIEPMTRSLSRHEHKIATHDVLISEDEWKAIADETQADIFITNPPWLNTKESGYLLNSLIQRLSAVRPTWLLLKGAYLWNLRSANQIAICTEIVPIGRVKWIEGTDQSGKEDSAWFKFDQTKPSMNPGPIVHPRRK